MGIFAAGVTVGVWFSDESRRLCLRWCRRSVVESAIVSAGVERLAMVVPQSCPSSPDNCSGCVPRSGWSRWGGLGLSLILLIGCQRQPLEFEPDRLSQIRLERLLGEAMDSSAEQVTHLLEQWFGTPDAPLLPSFVSGDPELAIWFDREQIERSAGAVGRGDDRVERGLYRKLCVQCHGISGDGRGPAAALQSVYPRDFRRGTFKYKSTARGEKPTEEDLLWVLRHGLAGTAMPAFAHWELSEFHTEDLIALSHYVRYLALRGEAERTLLMLAGEWGASAESDAAGRQSQWPEAMLAEAESAVQRIAQRWAAAEAQTLVVPAVPDYLAELERQAAGGSSDIAGDQTAALPTGWERAWEASAARGAALFHTPRAMCSTCHRLEPSTTDPPRDYDEWTKDWTIRAGIDPDDRSAWRPLKPFGALKPVKVYPRQLRLGVFRGRSDPASLYRRLVAGIDGSPMPPVVTDQQHAEGLSEQEIWDLVAWLLWLPRDDPPQPSPTNQEVGDAQAT
jgi:cytochrome c553